MDTQMEQKKSNSFVCIKCDVVCRRKYNYERHCLTDKHKRIHNDTKKEQIEQQPDYTCHCGNTYKYSQGLSKHKKQCISTPTIKSNPEPTEKELIMTLIKQNTELQDKVIELCKNGIIHNTVNTNSHNKTFNLQFFLNETCKDAINIMDFVKSITLQLSDLENVGRMGYVEGISNIITSKLNLLEENKRPIHCTDAKRETLYVKDENKWERESEEKPTIRKVIHTVANKNIQMVPVFKEKHPDYGQGDSNTSDQYQQIVFESLGGDGDEIEQENKIIKNISKEVIVQKSSQ